MKNGVAITGMGVVSAIGLDVASVTASLHAARSGIRLLRVPPIERDMVAGVIEANFEDAFTRLELPFLDRCQQMAILAARQAAEDAGIDSFAAFGQRAGVYYGNVNGGVATQQSWYQQMLLDGKQAARPYTIMAIMGNAGAAQVAIRHKVLGPVITNATACGSSGVAIGDAARAIRDGYLDVAIAGGAEAPLIASAMGVFQGTRAMSGPDPSDASRSCRPFARNRTGLVLGEGAAFLVLESAAHAHARGAHCHGYVTGYGVSSDAHHIGMPATEGQVRALRAALHDASLQPADIGYVNAHATATEGGDIIEAASIREVFGAGPEATRVSSTKSVHGHLIGATSALELLITVVAMEHSLLPASAHLDEVDPRCALNHVGNRPIVDHPIHHALSFSCGFGGTNVALVVSRQEPPPTPGPNRSPQ